MEDDDKLHHLVEKIADLQYAIQDMCIDYFCFDYKIISFYMMNPLQVLQHITDNIDLVGDKTKVDLFVTQLKDFIEYYEVQNDDVDVLKHLVTELLLQLGLKTDLVEQF